MLRTKSALFALLAASSFFSACAHEAPAPVVPAPRVAKALPVVTDSVNDAADRAIERSVRELLELSGLSTFDVFVRSRGGNVLLSGNVPNVATAQTLLRLTRNLKNVRAVNQDIAIVAPPAPPVVVAESDAGLSWAWPLTSLITLVLGYAIGRRRRPRPVVSTTNISAVPKRDADRADLRAS